MRFGVLMMGECLLVCDDALVGRYVLMLWRNLRHHVERCVNCT